MDRRQQKSRAAIFAAFESLLAKENYGRITVQDIIEEANVGRTTFYAHFETKDALLEELCSELFHHVFSEHPGAENTHDFSLSQGDSRTIVAHILYHLRDNGKSIARLLVGESSEIFLQYFRVHLNELVLHTLLNGMKPENPRVSSEFLENHVIGSFVNMVQWWIRRGMKETPEELADSFLAVIEPILQRPQKTGRL